MELASAPPALKQADQQNPTEATSPTATHAGGPEQQPSVVSIECRAIVTRLGAVCMRMGPPATLRNWKFHKPLLAVGGQRGIIQVFNLASGKLFRELSVHSYCVRGIEWVGLNAFISYAVSDSHQGNDSNWELHVTELDTGRSVALKSGKTSESSVIQSVKVSHLKQYFIIVYKSNPFEIWDLTTLSLLRRVPKKFSCIVAAEWSPLYSKKEPSTDSADGQASAPLRENFVVTNKSGELFHFSIAGSVVKEISKIPPESNMSKTVTAIAWKSDHVVLGRKDGNLSVWDLEKRESRILATGRGCIRKIRFAPGRGNMKIMIVFEDGVDVWDVRKIRLVKSVFSTRRQLTEVEDGDWAASDRPVILNPSGTIVVTDLEFKNYLEGSPQDLRQYRLKDGSSRQTNSEPCYLQ